MPNSPDTDGFKAAQSHHADEIKTSRALAKATGIPLQFLRNRLRDAGRDEAKRQVAPAPTVSLSEANTPPLPSVPDGHGNFVPPSFTPVVETPTTPAIPGPVAQKKVIIIDNGTANYYNIAATFVAAV